MNQPTNSTNSTQLQLSTIKVKSTSGVSYHVELVRPLVAHLEHLAITNNFFKSLLSQYSQRHYLSVNQYKPLERRYYESLAASAESEVIAESGKSKPTQPNNRWQPIFTKFDAAISNGVKNPRIRLGDYKFKLITEPSNRNVGYVYIYHDDNAGYVGKLSAVGQFYAYDYQSQQLAPKLLKLIDNIDAELTAYGHRTGACSCCGRTLTAKASIDLGIGPVCAENFGL